MDDRQYRCPEIGAGVPGQVEEWPRCEKVQGHDEDHDLEESEHEGTWRGRKVMWDGTYGFRVSDDSPDRWEVVTS